MRQPERHRDQAAGPEAQAMTGREDIPATTTVASLLGRLETMDAVVRAVLSDTPMTAVITLRGLPEKRVYLDYSKRPGSIVMDGEARQADVHVTAQGRVMHAVLLGRLPAGVALGRRELLLRGSAYHLSKLIPLFDISPVLYLEHLSDMGFGPYSRKEESNMSRQEFKGDPIPITHVSLPVRVLARIVNFFSFMLGFTAGFLRYRVLKSLSLFGVVAALARGLDAATPRKLKEGPEEGNRGL
jgi:hypothetical protein